MLKKCGMKLLIHPLTSTIAPLKFVNGLVISSLGGLRYNALSEDLVESQCREPPTILNHIISPKTVTLNHYNS